MMYEPPSFSEEELEKAREDFRVFVFILWKLLNLPEPTPAQYAIARYLQNGPKRSIIEAFRGVGKSWLTSGFVVWSLWRDPDTKVLVVSASKERADAFSTFVKQIISTVPFLQHLRARPDQRDAMVAFDVGPARPDHSPSVKSVGITGQLTGSRADIIVADDCETPNNSATQIMRDKLSEAVKEFDAILKPLDSARIIYLGTPQTEQSLYNVLADRGYEVRVWPAEYPSVARIDKYKGRLFPEILRTFSTNPKIAREGAPTDPKRFSAEDLAERRMSYGRSGYALQFMLDTTLSDTERYPLKVADLIVTDVNPELGHTKLVWGQGKENRVEDIPNLAMTGDHFYRPLWVSDKMVPYEGTVMSIDPSGRGKDETGYAVVSHLDAMLFCPAFGGCQGGYDESTLATLALVAKKHRVNKIVVEANFGDGMFTQLFKPILLKYHPCEIEEVKHNTQKEARIIDTLEPVLSSHRLAIDATALKADAKGGIEGDPRYSLVHQLTRLTRDRGALVRDDRLDALAIAVAYWTSVLVRSTEDAEKARVEAAREAAIKAFMERIERGRGGGRKGGASRMFVAKM